MSGGAMRLFIAIDLAAEVKAELSKLENELRPRLREARFVRVDNLHWTLRFLGETSPERASSVARGLGSELVAHASFALDVRGLGVFPDAKRPRVLWVGVHDPPEALFHLQSIVEQVSRGAGFRKERRGFEPHVTLARFRRPARGVESILEPFQGRDFGRSPAREVVLYESRLSPSGSSYVPVERFHLRPGGIDGKMLV